MSFGLEHGVTAKVGRVLREVASTKELEGGRSAFWFDHLPRHLRTSGCVQCGVPLVQFQETKGFEKSVEMKLSVSFH